VKQTIELCGPTSFKFFIHRSGLTLTAYNSLDAQVAEYSFDLDEAEAVGQTLINWAKARRNAK
jgi:hypothetical protein